MSSGVVSASIKTIVPDIVEQYMSKCSVTWEVALEQLYKSAMYKKLESSESELYDLSPLLLCDLLIEECKTGVITWPEEQQT